MKFIPLQKIIIKLYKRKFFNYKNLIIEWFINNNFIKFIKPIGQLQEPFNNYEEL